MNLFFWIWLRDKSLVIRPKANENGLRLWELANTEIAGIEDAARGTTRLFVKFNQIQTLGFDKLQRPPTSHLFSVLE